MIHCHATCANPSNLKIGFPQTLMGAVNALSQLSKVFPKSRGKENINREMHKTPKNVFFSVSFKK